jgi:hypothetical protein
MTYEHPHMKAARMEAAIEVLGVEVSRAAIALQEEQAKASPDLAVIASLKATLSDLWSQQDELRPDDLERVEQILSRRAS